MSNYALFILFSKDMERLVLVGKTTGPEHLAGRLCFPGGPVADGGSPERAAYRGLFQETGVQNVSGINYLGKWSAEKGDIHVVTATTDRIETAITVAGDAVYALRTADVLRGLATNPERFPPHAALMISEALTKLAGPASDSVPGMSYRTSDHEVAPAKHSMHVNTFSGPRI